VRIRLARPGDEADIVAMIHELAEFERAPEQCTVTESQITAALFGEDPHTAVASCHLAEIDGATACQERIALGEHGPWADERASTERRCISGVNPHIRIAVL
jgi:hypothetical protein